MIDARTDREVLITGVGLVSCLGEGDDAHRWASLPPSRANTVDWAPYAFLPLAAVEFDKQIPKKSDQRQMALCQRIGTYAAGLALRSAGLSGRADFLARMDMIAATAGGERDLAVDDAVLAGLPTAADPGAFLNETLMSDLRPTFFLGQLPNLLAANISIVHGVTGSARTLLGEEAAGIDAVRIASAQIASGQSDLVLVGGSCNGSRKDLLLYLVAGRHALSGEVRPVFDRAVNGGGVVLGSMGAFLVLEAADHASSRGAPAFARVTRVVSDAAAAEEGARAATLDELWSQIEPHLQAQGLAIISGASGAEPATSIERSFLQRRSGVAMRAPGTHIGYGMQAQFPATIGIAALLLKQGHLYPGGGALEADLSGGEILRQIVVTGVGRHYGEGMALLDVASGPPS